MRITSQIRVFDESGQGKGQEKGCSDKDEGEDVKGVLVKDFREIGHIAVHAGEELHGCLIPPVVRHRLAGGASSGSTSRAVFVLLMCCRISSSVRLDAL